MIINFKDKRLKAFYENTGPQTAKYFPPDLWERILDKLSLIKYAQSLNDLRIPPANHLELLSGNYAGFYSIRVNKKYRLIFRPENDTVFDLALIDYH